MKALPQPEGEAVMLLRWCWKAMRQVSRQRRQKRQPRRARLPLSFDCLEGREVPAAALTASQAFVTHLYQDLLGRAVEQSTLTALSTQFDQGTMTQAQVVDGVMTSAEYYTDEVNNTLQEVLGRAPTSDELSTQSAYLMQHGSVLLLEAEVLASDEYHTNQGGTDAGFLAGLYQTVLHRSADSAGQHALEQLLANGVSRFVVADGVILSPESTQDIVQSLYSKYLGRPVDSASLSVAMASLEAGQGLELLESVLLKSPEYYSHAGTPPAPTGLALDAASDSGTAGDNITNVNTPTIDGSAQDGSTVTILSDGASVGTGTAGADGSFKIAVSTLADGAHSITATATDSSGRTSVPSTALSITIDTAAPPAPTIALAAASDSGTVGDNATNVNTPTFTGTAEAGSTVIIKSDGTSVGTATASSSGNYSIAASTLTDGTHSITATATDVAGNVSAASTTLSLTIDTVAPAAPSTPALAPASDSGTAGDNITNVSTPTFTGTAEAGSTVTIKSDGTTVGTGTTNSSGNFSIATSALTDGTHSITATATDVEGNVSAASTAVSVTIDTVAPAAPSTPALAPASDSGTAGDNITNVNTPTFTGTAEAGSTVTIKSDGTSVGTATADSSGNYSVTTSTLSDGVHSITATATDVAGNVSAASAALSVTIDTVAPSITNLAANPNPFSVTTDQHTTIGYTLSESASVTINIVDANNTTVKKLLVNAAQAAGANSLSWDGTDDSGSVVADGMYTITVSATDAAGNQATTQSISVTKAA
jgi:flagellar hook assembly protein FlgD